MYSAAQLKQKLPFQIGKQHRLAREKIWKKIDKSILNYIKLREAKKFIKNTIKIPFKYDEKEEEEQIIAGYNYAKNFLVPLKHSDPMFAEQTVSKNQFKYFLRHMRLYYETLFAWKKFHPTEENSIQVDKLKKVVEKLKTWGHLYLNGWDVEKIVEEFGTNGAFSLKQLLRFSYSVATKFEYNKEGEDNHVGNGSHEHAENGQNDDKNLTNGSRSELDKKERHQVESQQNISLTKTETQQKQQQMTEKQQKPGNSINHDPLYADNQQQMFYQPLSQNQDLHHQRIKYSYVGLFQMAKERFYQKYYDEGLSLIDQCIEIDPTNSILYTNRALLYTELDLIDYAFADLCSALEMNHLNYIAYFNLFSLLSRLNRDEQAFENLSCALSCLYLIKAKNSKNQIDVSKAIKYAENNLEAHVLKAMMHLQNGKLKLALNELNWASEINPKLTVLKSVRNFLLYQLSPEEQFEQGEELQQEEGKEFIRLEGSYQPEQENDRAKQTEQKINEFNKLYTELKVRNKVVNIYAKATNIDQVSLEHEGQVDDKEFFKKEIGTVETLQTDLELIEQ